MSYFTVNLDYEIRPDLVSSLISVCSNHIFQALKMKKLWKFDQKMIKTEPIIRKYEK